jgi:urease accessory protein
MSVRMGKKFTGMGVEVIGATRLRSWRECIEESVTPGRYPIALAINFANTGPACQPGLCRAPVWRCA